MAMSPSKINPRVSRYNAYRKREVCVVLEENRYGLPDVVEFERADVLASEKDGPLVGVIQAHGKLQNSTLSCSIGSYNDLGRCLIRKPSENSRIKRTQSWPGSNLNETFRRAYSSASGYLKDTFLSPSNISCHIYPFHNICT